MECRSAQELAPLELFFSEASLFFPVSKLDYPSAYLTVHLGVKNDEGLLFGDPLFHSLEVLQNVGPRFVIVRKLTCPIAQLFPETWVQLQFPETRRRLPWRSARRSF